MTRQPLLVASLLRRSPGTALAAFGRVTRPGTRPRDPSPDDDPAHRRPASPRRARGIAFSAAHAADLSPGRLRTAASISSRRKIQRRPSLCPGSSRAARIRAPSRPADAAARRHRGRRERPHASVEDGSRWAWSSCSSALGKVWVVWNLWGNDPKRREPANKFTNAGPPERQPRPLSASTTPDSARSASR
jgi:hypothetical protein